MVKMRKKQVYEWSWIGHTFAHGFEAAKKFTKKVSHGEAVLLGMMMASQLSYQKKLLPIKDLI